MTTIMRPADRAAAQPVGTRPDGAAADGSGGSTARRVGHGLSRGVTELLSALEKHWSTMMMWRL